MSPYISILCAEIFALLIRNKKRIKENIECVSAQFADDTTVTLDGTGKGLYIVLNILNFVDFRV